MSAQDRAIQKLARELAGIKKEVVSWRGPQADYTSIENGGNFTFKDSDGNVTAVVGGQDDGSNTIRHVDGPVPAVPAGLSAHVDGPIIQAAWDGTFESDTTYDWAYLEVEATGPSGELVRSTITDTTGGSVAFTATASGDWVIVARSVSRAERRSLDGDAGTVTVELVGLSGAINDAIGSANGKNTVTYAEVAPTPADEGIVGDTWWVGQVGRPNDIIEATNQIINPSFEVDTTGWSSTAGATLESTDLFAGQMGGTVGSRLGRLRIESGWSSAYANVNGTQINVVPGEWVATRVWAATDAGVQVRMQYRFGAAGQTYSYSSSPFQQYTFYFGGFLVHAAQVPPGLTQVRVSVQIYSGSAAFLAPGVRLWIDQLNAVSALSEDTARSVVGHYFDGDSTSGATDNESHYRWTGTPHASTSQKYLPAIVGSGSDAWNITEQWQFTSAGWKPVEVSHEVIATVDLGKATVGELDGIRIMGQTIRGEQLSGDAIDGKVITGGTYRTTGGSGSWSDDGLFIAQPDGTSMVRFPTDGSPLSLTASDVQIDRASITDLDLSYGAVRSGGALTLASGVTPPASPPELTTGWQKVVSLEPGTGNGTYKDMSLAYWPEGAGHWVRAANIYGIENDGSDAIEFYNATTGTYERRFTIEINPNHGITIMGDIVYVMGQGHGSGADRDKVFIDGYDLATGARTSRFQFVRGIQAQNALGNDGTNLIVASVWGRRLWVHRWNPVTGVQVGSDMLSAENTWPTADASGLHGVSINAAGTEVTVVPGVSARVYSISGGVLTHKADPANANGLAGWKNPPGPAGYVVRDGIPHIVDGQGSIYWGVGPASDATVDVCFTWYDGTYETTPSPVVAAMVPARFTPSASFPVRPGLQKRMYVRTGSSGWARYNVPEARTVQAFAVFTGTQALPTVNTFPAATPATLKSTNNKFVVNGDGSGTWGPLTFNADGTMSSSQVPAWVPVTTFLNGATVQTFGFAPAYRVWPDGKVEWRGVIKFPATSATLELLTVPTVARPAEDVHVAAAASSPSTGQARLDVCDPNSPTTIRVGPTGSKEWVSLDGLHYYLT